MRALARYCYYALVLLMPGCLWAAPGQYTHNQDTGRRQVPLAVASIAPIQSLLANVMQGVGKPVLLLPPGASPHSFTLRPSDAELLARADIIFWVGECGERALIKPLSVLASGPGHHVVTLAQENALPLLAVRPTGIWTSQGSKIAYDPKSCGADPHIWLDPDVAVAIVAVMMREMGTVDPVHAALYTENGKHTIDRIRKLDKNLQARLQPVHDIPFLVYHDAFQYFEAHYGLNAVGSVATGSDVPPGARLVRKLRREMMTRHISCLFTEPQFSPALADTILENTSVRVGVLDPLGAGMAPGPDTYFHLMTNLGNSLASCLKRH